MGAKGDTYSKGWHALVEAGGLVKFSRVGVIIHSIKGDQIKGYGFFKHSTGSSAKG